MTARSLYRCYLSCKDAFPGAYLKEELGKAVWKEACAREGADPNLYHRDKEVRLISSFCHMWHGFK